MKKPILMSAAQTLTTDLDSLNRLKPDALKERWRTWFGAEPPDRLRRDLLIQALAYRMQERSFGGLKAATRRLLERIAGEARAHRSITVQAKRRVTAGAVLIRDWHGTRHQVTAVADGFLFQGKRYHSLSRIAREITGVRWSGPLFFGLKETPKEPQDGVR